MNQCARPKCFAPATTLNMCRTHYQKFLNAGMGRAGQCRRIDSAPVVEHIGRLRALGWMWAQIGNAAGTVLSVPHHLYTGYHSRVSVKIAEAILAIPLEPVLVESTIPVPAVGTRRRLEALSRIGWSGREVSERIGYAGPSLWQMTARGHVSARVFVRVAKLYNELCNTPGPSRLAQIKATKRGWASPAAWEDIDMDDPATVPCLGAPEESEWDEVLVDLVVRGEVNCGRKEKTTVPLPDRLEAVRRMLRMGFTSSAMSWRLGSGQETAVKYIRQIQDEEAEAAA